MGRRFLTEWQVPRKWSLDAPSPFEKVRVLDPEPAGSLLEEARENLSRAFPFFSNMVEAERWAGLIDVTPDAVPVISPVDALPGFFIVSGLSGHGFGFGPGAGRLMADLVTGAPPIVDPTPFRYSRFFDGITAQAVLAEGHRSAEGSTQIFTWLRDAERGLKILRYFLALYDSA